MATVSLRFPPAPEHVRIARLVAAAVARLNGMDESGVDEVRQAIGEACARAVRVQGDTVSAERVLVELTDDGPGLVATVRDHGPEPQAVADVLDAAGVLVSAAGDSTDSLPAGFRLAVLQGLVDDVVIDRDGDETAVRMSWAPVLATLR